MSITLYRFRPFNQHTITELLTEKLHFSHPNTWNDPFEDDSDVIYLNRYACFTENTNDGEKDALQNILMWSHYADSHKGICIEYEHDTDYTMLASGYRMQYQQQKSMDACKNICWKYENEYRIVAYYQSLNFQGVNASYRSIGLKIKAIYCGVKFEESQLETLKVIKGSRDFAIFTGTVENYASIKFEKIQESHNTTS